MVEILALCNPYKLSKNLGALSEYAEGSQSSTKKILTLYPGYDGMVKKTIARYCPFKNQIRRKWFQKKKKHFLYKYYFDSFMNCAYNYWNPDRYLKKHKSRFILILTV
jgi:hypothetical protein